MSITRGHLPLLIICLSLILVLPAYAQSEGEQRPGVPPVQGGQGDRIPSPAELDELVIAPGALVGIVASAHARSIRLSR